MKLNLFHEIFSNLFRPEDTIWQDGIFKLFLTFTEEYPNKPPIIKFVTKIFHPNVYNDGNICLDILNNQWSPIYDVSSILTSIQSLLTDPNPNSPANTEASRLYTENRKVYEKRVREIVEKSWIDDNEPAEDDGEDDGEDEDDGEEGEDEDDGEYEDE